MIGFERSKEALEAGWKYVILSSVGIALALFGTILVYYSSGQAEALRWVRVYRLASKLDPTAMKVAFVFVLIGYGTKSGRGADAHVAARRACAKRRPR